VKDNEVAKEQCLRFFMGEYGGGADLDVIKFLISARCGR